MKLSYQQEDYKDVVYEIETLHQMHYDEVAIHQDYIPLAKNYAGYWKLYSDGKLFCMTVRNEAGRLIGYVLAIIQWGLHNATSIFANTDLHFLQPEYRRGFAGIRLFVEYERILKSLGVEKVTSVSKTHIDRDKIYDYLGWDKQEVVYTKIIKENTMFIDNEIPTNQFKVNKVELKLEAAHSREYDLVRELERVRAEIVKLKLILTHDITADDLT